MFVVFGIVSLLATAALFIYLLCRKLPCIRCATVRMKKPFARGNGHYLRNPAHEHHKANMLVTYEARLRKMAYKNTVIKTGESFYNDSDMDHDYFLVVVYDKRSSTPLLSARYYTNAATITRCLRGDKTPSPTEMTMPQDEPCFLADRLSGNISSPIYRRFRTFIFLQFYAEMFIRNPKGRFILMARKEHRDKLLKKYLRIGLSISGTVMHKEKEHWILQGHVRKSAAILRKHPLFSFIFRCKLMTRQFYSSYVQDDKRISEAGQVVS